MGPRQGSVPYVRRRTKCSLSEETGVNRIPQRLRFLNNLEIKPNCCWAHFRERVGQDKQRKLTTHSIKHCSKLQKDKRKP